MAWEGFTLGRGGEGNKGLNRIPERRGAPPEAQSEHRSIPITPKMAALLAGRDQVSEISARAEQDPGPFGRWGRPGL